MSEVRDPGAAVDLLRQAAQLIREDPIRQQSLLSFGSAGQLVVTGDMHGHLGNFAKLQRFCALERSPGRYVILQELIHEECAANGQGDGSIELLVRAAAWKCQFPDNVFFLQSNHELAQLYGQEITKGGRSVVLEFERGVAQRYGRDAPRVLEAVNEYIAALPLAARTTSGIFIAHSLPDALAIGGFDPQLLYRCPTPEEMAPGGPGYALLWGRFHTPEAVEAFARKVGASIVIAGHTPQETGYMIVGRLLILASDHSHGVFLPIDLSRRYTMDELEAGIRKFVSVE